MDQRVVEGLQAAFKHRILGKEFSFDMLSITIDKSVILQVLHFLYQEKGLEYRFLTTLCGMHHPGQPLELAVVYHLHSFSNNHRIRLKAFTSLDDPSFPSATALFPTANWMERETWDFFGIRFEGHPRLTRILNVDDFEGFPLRKDFPLEDQTREDKDDTMFGR